MFPTTLRFYFVAAFSFPSSMVLSYNQLISILLSPPCNRDGSEVYEECIRQVILSPGNVLKRVLRVIWRKKGSHRTEKDNLF